MNQRILIAVVALVLGLGIGYFLPHGTPIPQGGQIAGRGSAYFMRGGMGGPGANGMGFLAGSVAGVSGSTLTLDTRDGSSHVVILTPQTAVSKSVSGSLSDITTGANVIVSGTTGSDGSVTASLIQLRPAGSASTTFPGR